LAGLVSGHHEGLDGDTKTRGGLGADDCAIIGRYSRAIGQLSFSREISLRGHNEVLSIVLGYRESTFGRAE
jgi:hypothetical protein